MGEEREEGKQAKNPPFLVYKKKLYVLAKGDRPAPEEGEGKAPVAVVRKPVRRPAPAQRRPAQFRPRPYVKGVYRCYSDRTPHLVPMRVRRKKRTV